MATTTRVSQGELAVATKSPITREDVAIASTTYDKDYDLAGATLRQCADEIEVIVQASLNGCNSSLIHTALLGIAKRMAMAADVAELVDGGAS